MFRKNKDEEQEHGDEPQSQDPGGRQAAEDDLGAPPLKPFSKRGSHAPAKPPAKSTFHPDVPRRVVDIPGSPRRGDQRGRGNESDSKRLTVGRDICLAGEITSCDKLVVEGRVEATLTDARSIEVSSTGVFKGKALVEEADISGRYEGELVAQDKLIVRPGGHVSGSIRYGKIVIESGGQVSGDMRALDDESPATPGSGSDAS